MTSWFEARIPSTAKRRVLIAAGAALALIAFSITYASASQLSMSSPPGVRQDVGVDKSVRSTVRDRFNSASTVNLSGLATDFHGGDSWMNDGGPLWAGYTNGAASANWVNSSSNYVTRNSGGSVHAAALVPWLTRDSTVSLRMRTLSTSMDGGVIVGANSNGSAGLVARLFHTGSNYAVQFWLVTGANSWSSCGAAVNTGTASGGRYDITVTYTPGTGAAASATFNKSGGGGGTFNITSTCSLATANGAYAGMFSAAPSTVRYDNFFGDL